MNAALSSDVAVEWQRTTRTSRSARSAALMAPDLDFLRAFLAYVHNLHDRLGRVTGVGLLQQVTGLVDGRCADARVFGFIQSPLRLAHLRAVLLLICTKTLHFFLKEPFFLLNLSLSGLDSKDSLLEAGLDE